MTETELKAGFYNAVMVDDVPDRTYNAEDINEYLKGLISDNGVFANVSTACQVLKGNGMEVVVKAGRGKVNNHWFKIESDTTLDIEAADVILNRIDSIVVVHSGNDRNVKLTVKKGTLATNPVAPTLSRTNELYEICLANILVNKNTTTITTTMITDTRPNNNVCGWITGLINQMDTTTLYNQYEAAQEEFIEDKTIEFNNWFETIKDDVRATNLYREYEALYRNVEAGEQTITIPNAVNYVNNGLDVLNVKLNGLDLIKNVEYTISSDGKTITLTNALDEAMQDIVFVNKKSIEGTGAESVVVQVESLQGKVNSLTTNIYTATGTDDNIKLSNIVKDFLNGTGDYSSAADNASMKLNVSGVLSIENLIDESYVFDFQVANASNRRIIIDFGDSTIPLNNSVIKTTNLAVFAIHDDVIVENVNMKIAGCSTPTIYGFHGGVARNCKIVIDNSTTPTTNIYGIWGAEEISNSKINIIGQVTGTLCGAYSVKKVITNEIKSNSGNSIIATNGQLLLGNIVNQNVSKTSGTVEIGTITE